MNSMNRIFARRCVICYFLLCVFLLLCVLRLSTAATGNYAAVQGDQMEVTVDFYRPRGTIYDCAGRPLTNRTEKVRAAVIPTAENIAALRETLSDEDFAAVRSAAESGKAIVCDLPETVEQNGIFCASVQVAHESDQPAVHLIGTLDADGHGTSGLEAAFDEVLYGELSQAVFRVNGRGSVLGGEAVDLYQTSNENAVITTLDLSVQQAVERAVGNLPCGAVLLCDLNGNIRAGVSRPTFDCTDLSATADRDDSPQMNRLLTAYSVGSVFKPCVAAAGLENGTGNPRYYCGGKTVIGKRTFCCHKTAGHGWLNVADALRDSCNIYFYQYAKAVGSTAICHMAQTLEFGTAIRLCDRLFSGMGNLPDASQTVADAALFNFGIGQGDLLLSPIALCTLYSAIARDGSYILPHLVAAVKQDGKTETVDLPAPTVAMTPKTAAVLRNALKTVVTDGTGTAAQTDACTVAGKTATAQTGRYENGKECTVGWFCGFFPADNPQYVGVVTVENANGSKAADYFAKVVEAVMGI